MHLLALESFYGGSHRAFLEQWSERSRHHFTLETLSGHHWKWRMRQSPIHFARVAAARLERGESFDLLWCSDMVPLAELVGLLPAPLRSLPRVVYFHENQLTYPVRDEAERDLHFALSNLTSALAADAVWFNSAFHRDSLLAAVPRLLARMPSPRLDGVAEAIAAKARVEWPGIEDPLLESGTTRRVASDGDGPLRVVWVSRWEHDKDPETFFAALLELRARGTPFRVSVLGESFARAPEVFERGRAELAENIDLWGYRESREEYLAVLAASDVVVSTAQHEFFGLAVAEAIAHGAFPLLPDRLAYPELLGGAAAEERADCFYDGSVGGLVVGLERLARARREGRLDASPARRAVERFFWSRRAAQLDAAASSLGAERRATTAERS